MSYILPPKPPPLVYFERTLFHQPVVDFPFKHPNISKKYFVSKAVWRCNLVKVLGQQPRYQLVPSSITMWQLFHKEPSVSSWHHKLLTRQLLPTYTPWRRWGHRPQNKRSIEREDSTTRVLFTTRDKEFKSNGRFGLKRFKCSVGTSTISRYSVLYYPIMADLLVSEWQLLL